MPTARRPRGATGRGGRPKAGLAGFSVSHLRIPTLPQPWEGARALNPRISAIEIPDAGHYIHDDQPALFAQAIAGFLRPAGTTGPAGPAGEAA